MPCDLDKARIFKPMEFTCYTILCFTNPIRHVELTNYYNIIICLICVINKPNLQVTGEVSLHILYNNIMLL